MTREEIKKMYLESNKEYSDTKYIYWLEGKLIEAFNKEQSLKQCYNDIYSLGAALLRKYRNNPSITPMVLLDIWDDKRRVIDKLYKSVSESDEHDVTNYVAVCHNCDKKYTDTDREHGMCHRCHEEIIETD